MDVVDEKLWAQTRQAYIDIDPEEGGAIVRLAESWATEIEKFEQAEVGVNKTFRDAMDWTLPAVDDDDVSGSMLVEVLVVLSQVWARSEDLINHLSYIEKKVLAQAYYERLQLQAREAAIEGPVGSANEAPK